MKYLLLSCVLIVSDIFVREINVRHGHPTGVTSFADDPWERAITDNIYHAFMGGISWFMFRSVNGAVILSDNLIIFEGITASFMSSVIDVDHFIEAKSLNLKDVSQLKSRPFFHCSTLLIFVFLVMVSIGLFFHLWWLHTFSFICLVGWTCHHLRDGLRHGLWFCPFGSTPQINYPIYLLLIVVMPVAYCVVYEMTAALVMKTKPGYRNLIKYTQIINTEDNLV